MVKTVEDGEELVCNGLRWIAKARPEVACAVANDSCS